MSKSGDKIDYSLRIQKSIERKIFGDIIRTLNYFGSVDSYRYIGFGSFYFKDFLMFYEDFNIHNGISIEIDSDGYVNKRDFIECIQRLYLEVLDRDAPKIADDIVGTLKLNAQQFTSQDICSILRLNSKMISEFFIEKISEYERDLFPNNRLKGNSEKYYKCLSDINDSISWILQSNLYEKVKESVFDKVTIDERAEVLSTAKIEELVVEPSKYIVVDKNILQREVQKILTNRFVFNKPYGFIELTFGELSKAIDSIDWSEEQKNIIWIDYDEFIDGTQLLGLEKCILNSSRGDLILFSTSMGSNADDRFDSLNELKNTTNRIVGKVLKKECDDRFIYRPIRKMVSNTIKAALAKKNAARPNGVPAYNITNVLECTYSDGMPMYTYGIIVHYRKDKETNRQFPVNYLKDKKWFPKEDECYKIYVPALTHKEINAINQLLPTTNLEVLYEKFPFINKSIIKKYVEIWNYYPHFFEVGPFV